MKKQTKCVCILDLPASVFTDTAGYGVVPLCQGIGNCQTFNSTRSLQHITWTAFKPNHSADSKVVPHAAAISGLRDRAALGGAGLWHSFGKTAKGIVFGFYTNLS